MSTAWELDFTDTTGEGQEQEATVEPLAWYKATLSDVFANRKTNDLHFKFTVLDGPYENFVIEDRLTNPANADTDEKRRFIKNRARLFARRLGLVSEEEKSMAGVDYFDAVGKEVWLYVVEQTWKLKDGSGEGRRVSPSFEGIYAIDDPRVQEKMAKTEADKAAANGTAPAKTGAGEKTKTPAAPASNAKKPAPAAADPHAEYNRVGL